MDAELVDKIVQQVIEALRAQGAAPGPPADTTVRPTSAAPASQAKDSPQAKAPARPAAGAPARPLPKQFVVTREPIFNRRPAAPAEDRKLFITAEMLTQRLAGGQGKAGQIELAHNEFLTPAADDLAEQKHLSIRRKPKPIAPAATTKAAPVPAAPAPQARAGGVGIVVSGADEKVASAVAALQRDGLALVDYSQTDCWMQNLLSLAAGIRAGAVPVGVAILPYAADAMALAGKIKGVRAVQGTRPESVAAAVRRFGANLLILEHVFLTYHELRAMVRQFAAPRQAPTYARLLERLAELEA